MSNKNNFKAYFVDLDGTLLDSHDEFGRPSISKTNINAIAKAEQEGKSVIISTGRLGVNAMPYLERIKAKYGVLANGAQIFVKGKIVKEFKLTVQQCLKIVDIIQTEKMIFKTDDSFNAWGVYNRKLELYARMFGFVPKKSFAFEMHKEYRKIVIWGKTPRGILRVAEKIKKVVKDVSVVTSGHGWTIEITNEKATKGIGNEYIINNYLNIPRQATAHIGDTMNDSTTVGHVGALIAMHNGDRNLKKMAQFIGPKYKKGGVAKVLEGNFVMAKR